MNIYIAIVLGLIIGSFLNVLVLRMNTGASLLGRSGCLSCRSQLGVAELVPVLSYMWQRGRCKSCESRVSLQYPLVEIFTALIFALVSIKVTEPLALLLTLTFFSLMIAIAVYDIHHKIIPNSLVYLSVIVAAVYSYLVIGARLWDLNIMIALYSAAFFALIWLVSQGAWMGLGDAKLAIALGLFLAWPQTLNALLLAFWIAAIVAVILMFASRKVGMKTEIPFAPFLILGAILAYLIEPSLFVI